MMSARNHRASWESGIVAGSLFEGESPGDWDKLGRRLGRTGIACYQQYLKENDLVIEYNAVEVSQIAGVVPVAAREWIKAGWLGRPRRATNPTNKITQRQTTHLRIPHSSLIAFFEDPVYAWLYDSRDLPREWQRVAVNRDAWYVDQPWLADRMAVSRHTVDWWRKKGFLPRLVAPGKNTIIPRPVADLLLDMYGDSRISKIAGDLHDMAEKIAGFDAAVAAPWRKTWNWEAK